MKKHPSLDPVSQFKRQSIKNESRTFIDNRYLMPIVHQSWQVSKTVLLGELLVVDLHETDAKLVRFVVDVLQLLESLRTLLTFWFI